MGAVFLPSSRASESSDWLHAMEKAEAPPNEVLMVTLQTRGMSLLARLGGPWKKIYNIGLGQPWEGYKTKFKLLQPFLESRKDLGGLKS